MILKRREARVKFRSDLVSFGSDVFAEQTVNIFAFIL